MSSFEKFMKDLEARQEKKRAEKKQLEQSETLHGVRHRVKLYTEKWQNSIRYSRGKK